ncbi:hypothetical protein H0H87_008699 [Tephrocybe sp. NHM501043]|nr:hypothetical protein H0H87_008699 [Tephrocybe sp. NHM501043]
MENSSGVQYGKLFYDVVDDSSNNYVSNYIVNAKVDPDAPERLEVLLKEEKIEMLPRRKKFGELELC